MRRIVFCVFISFLISCNPKNVSYFPIDNVNYTSWYKHNKIKDASLAIIPVNWIPDKSSPLTPEDTSSNEQIRVRFLNDFYNILRNSILRKTRFKNIKIENSVNDITYENITHNAEILTNRADNRYSIIKYEILLPVGEQKFEFANCSADVVLYINDLSIRFLKNKYTGYTPEYKVPKPGVHFETQGWNKEAPLNSDNIYCSSTFVLWNNKIKTFIAFGHIESEYGFNQYSNNNIPGRGAEKRNNEIKQYMVASHRAIDQYVYKIFFKTPFGIRESSRK